MSLRMDATSAGDSKTEIVLEDADLMNVAADQQPQQQQSVHIASQALWIEHEVPISPFVENEPKSVVVLTYQRSGSSFFGQMFNSNPDAFYMFEPLDSLYCALYGTSPGWNIPSDITTFWNGTQRPLPLNEIRAVATFLENIFTCNTESWPTETLTHRYWARFGGDHASSVAFVQCLRQQNYTSATCHEHTVPICGKRFGEKPPSRLDECNRLLWSEKFRAKYPNDEVRRAFARRQKCLTELRSLDLLSDFLFYFHTDKIGQCVVDRNCASLVTTACSHRNLRAVKTVRGTMDSMEQLLKNLPNLRIIHMIRDPRAVALSRTEFDASARGAFSNKAGPAKMATEAMIYCRTAANDVISRQRLSKLYPGRIYPIIYDDVVRDLPRYTRNVYRFIDEPIHAKTLKWVGNNLRRKRNGTAIATRWQDVLTVNQNEQILQACSELFRLLKAV